MNSFGRYFRLTSFGESHGALIGGVIDGCPANLELDLESIQEDLDRRRPGSTSLGTERNEVDKVRFVSGIFEGRTAGAPIAFFIENADKRSADYEALAHVFRPGHADYAYQQRYGHRDYRGGGRASARETAVRVVAAAIARQLLHPLAIDCLAYSSQIGALCSADYRKESLAELRERMSGNAVSCPDANVAEEMEHLIEEVRLQKDSIGAAVTLLVDGVPAAWGDPLFDKLHARFAYAMMSIPAVKGFDCGDGFDLVSMRGSEANDRMRISDDGKLQFLSNHAGGITGGISLGQRLIMRVAFKPISSIAQPQETVDDRGRELQIEIAGRHDPCVLPRALVVVEAMAYLVLADAYLSAQAQKGTYMQEFL